MTTMNPFDLLGDNDNDDPSQLIETASAQLQKAAAATATATTTVANNKKNPTQNAQQKPAKLPSKPLPPTQAVREARNDTGRGGRGAGRGGGRGRGGYGRDYPSNENAFNNSVAPGAQGEEGDGKERRSYGGPRPPYRGGRRGGFSNEEGRDGERPRRAYERRSGTGRGNEFKREGAGRGNWGSQSDEVAPGTEVIGEESDKIVSTENPPAGDDAVEANKEDQPEEAEEKEPEDKEMTLEEYEKVLEEKRKALLAQKAEERRVEVDKDLQSMQQLSNKKDDDPVFIKLGSDKDKKKEVSDREKAKKVVSINEFLKPAEGERYYSPGGRGRGRGRGPRGGGGGGNYGGSGGYGGGPRFSAPIIEDDKQFPTLGAPRA